MNLVLLTPEFSSAGGGIGTYYQHIAPALRDAGVRIRVIEGSAFYAGDVARREFDGCMVETLDRQRLLANYARFTALAATPLLRRHLSAAWAMWEQAQAGGEVDVIEAADWGLLFVPAAMHRSHPLVVQCHGSIGQIASFDPMAGQYVDGALAQLLERALIGSFGQAQTPSAANAKFWRDEARVHVAQILPAFALPPATPASEVSGTALVAGRLQRWKGPDILCEALDQLGAEAPIVDWYGRDMPWDRSDRTAAAYLAATYGSVWDTHFRYHAPIDRARLATMQARAMFSIVPSTWDVFNFTAVEALASGRPAIVSDAAGASELITDDENGFVFRSSDPNSLATAIQRVLQASPERRRAIGVAGLETVRTRLAPPMIAARRIELYEAAIRTYAAERPAPLEGWLYEICAPRPTASPNSHLDAYPVREMALNIMRRLQMKAGAVLTGLRP